MDLWTVADVVIAASGLDLDASAEDQLRELIGDGEAKLAESPERRAEAVENLMRLLTAVIEQARSTDRVAIDDASVDAALGLCPIWPFC